MRNAKKYNLGVICFFLVAFLMVGCGEENANNEPTESVSSESSQTNEDTETQKKEYRQFNANDFIDVVPGILMLYDGDSSNNIDLNENMKDRYYNGVIDEFTSIGDSSEQQISILLKYIVSDVICADSDDVEVDFIEYVQPNDKTYAYCKVNVLNENEIKNLLYADWKREDEIYLMADYSIGSVPSGKQAVKITCFIKNFSADENSNMAIDTQPIDTDSTDDEVLQTAYYSIKIPSDWKGKYSYDVFELADDTTAYSLTLNMQCKNGDAFPISQIMMYPIEDIAEQREYQEINEIGAIQVDSGNVYCLVSEMQYYEAFLEDETEIEQYKKMGTDVDSILSSITLNSNYDWIENLDTVVDETSKMDDTPYVDMSSAVLGMGYSQLLIQNDMYANDYPRDAMSRYGMQNDDDIGYKAVEDGLTTYYVGVKDDVIVSILQEGYSEYFRNIIASDGPLTEVSPKRVNAPNGEIILIWKLNNGYLIVSTYPSATTDMTGSYLDSTVNWYTFLTDPSTNEWMEWTAVPQGF